MLHTQPTTHSSATRRHVETYSAESLRREPLANLRAFAEIGAREGEFNSVREGIRAFLFIRTLQD